MKILKRVNEFIMKLALMAAVLVGCCLDSEGWWAMRAEACVLVVLITTLIMYYWLEEEEV